MSHAEIMKKIANAKSSAGGNVIRDGKGRLVVKRMAIETKFSGTMFICEFGVKESTATRSDVQANAAGSECSFVCNLDKNIAAPGKTKDLLLRLLGEDEDKISPDDFVAALANATGPENPCRGMVVDYETYRKFTRDGKKELVIPKFFHVEQTSEDVLRERAILDKTGASTS